MGMTSATATVVRRISASARVADGLKGSATISKSGGAVNYYDGAYEFTPGAEAQTIEIGGLTARENIIIDPIPSNYGLVEWNGITLTVR